MTQEDKQLLLKDLCSRLPYKVICDMWFEGNESDKITEVLKCGGLMRLMNSEFNFIAKPYLCPLSSMTEEEEKEYENCFQSDDTTAATLLIDFYNKHHFDYRGLIEKGLALEAPKDMYKTE